MTRMKNQRQKMIKNVTLFRFDTFYSLLRKFEKIMMKEYPKLFSKIKKTLKSSKASEVDFSMVELTPS